ncbi:bifunctional aconitate hydratase 2/2-methylisocitrate dehydratase [bacterium]|nr:bifunctional aconitate hydratase 2/2-methylisocitrate dehydratase [bacterium]
MLQEYRAHQAERAKQGIPPLPLNPDWTERLCSLLVEPPHGEETFLLKLIKERVSPGVDPAAKIKAEFLGKIAQGALKSPLINRTEAVFLLSTMLGGYNVAPLVALLPDPEIGTRAAEALKKVIFVFDQYNQIFKLSKNDRNAAAVIESWAEAEWFTTRPVLPSEMQAIVFKVNGEINTDDFSPAGHAWSRPDIPLHALSMGETRFPEGLKKIAELKESGYPVAFVGDVVGTGSSRKSACNSLIWTIGEDIPYIPNKRRGGLILGGQIAPIFFNTAEDSGALPIRCDVTRLETGMIITIQTKTGRILDHNGQELTRFSLEPVTLADEYQAGGRVNLIIGRNLTMAARKSLKRGPIAVFCTPTQPVKDPGTGYTLAQKIVGRACGLDGVLPQTACEPKATTVGSQDTTGLMTADELKELACLRFQSPFVMQSFCHTAAYPKPSDIKMHRELPLFMNNRGGVSLKPGDGVIHSWLNRFILPDTVGTGGDSHTRFPFGISFPAGSGLVAFAAALGYMPLDMPESVLVRFNGTLQPGITLRDVVNAIPYFAIKQGLLTVGKKGKKNIFNGRILEMEGLPHLSVEQAFELTDASAERSAAAATIKLDQAPIIAFLKSNIALMQSMIADGYKDAKTLKNRIAAMESWLAEPVLLEADPNADYAAVLDIDLGAITEPLLCCPNDPDDVKPLSEVAGRPIDEVFIGSCMTNIGHFRAAARIFEGQKHVPARVWLCPPTRMDQAQLKNEGFFAQYAAIGARIEIPGCSLCMGNQARVKPHTTVLSTSTRNFDNRIGDGAQVFLGSAELAAVTSLSGSLPTVEQYQHIMQHKIEPNREAIYRYLDFSK